MPPLAKMTVEPLRGYSTSRMWLDLALSGYIEIAQLGVVGGRPNQRHLGGVQRPAIKDDPGRFRHEIEIGTAGLGQRKCEACGAGDALVGDVDGEMNSEIGDVDRDEQIVSMDKGWRGVFEVKVFVLDGDGF